MFLVVGGKILMVDEKPAGLYVGGNRDQSRSVTLVPTPTCELEVGPRRMQRITRWY